MREDAILKRRGLTETALCCAWVGFLAAGLRDVSAAPSPDAAVPQLFSEGAALYAEGRASAAIDCFTQIGRRGYASPELHYNLGHCYLSIGDTGHAMLHYRKAWYDSPRDPAIRGRLALVSHRTGVTLPAGSRLLAVSRSEWALMAAVSYWVCFGLGLALLARSRSRALWRALAIAAAVLCVSLAGTGEWIRITHHDEAVVMQEQQDVHLAPTLLSRSTFTLPAGALVLIQERAEGWVKVAAGKQTGWMPERQLRRVRD